MNRSKALICSSLLLCIGGTAQAEYRLGNWDLTGSVLLEGQVVSGDNEKHAQFNKFTDVKDGVTGGLSLDGWTGDYHMGLSASDIGRDTQEYRLTGGRIGSFDYELFYNEIINNKAIYPGIVRGPWENAGSDTVAPPAGLDLSTANTAGEGFIPLEFKVNRKTYGGTMDLLKDSPFFAQLGYARENTSGIRAIGMAPVLSTSATALEIPEPIDYSTDNVNARLGYRSETMTMSFDGYFSNFNNNKEKLTWTPPNTAARNATGLKDTTLLAQDNKYWNLNLTDTIHDLPFDSTLTAKVGYSRISSKFDLLNSSNADLLYSQDNVAANRPKYGQITTVVTDRPDFDGKIEYKTANLAVASRPTESLDTKLYYGYLNKKNSSTSVTYSGFPNIDLRAGVPPANYNATSEVFSYFKHSAGADASYKLASDTKFGIGYDFLHINRTEGRPSNPENTDHKVSLGLSNNTADWLTSKIRYTYLARLAEYDGEEGFLFYDAAEKRQNTLALEFEAMPMEGLDTGVSASYSYAKYIDAETGRQNDHDLVVAADVGYQLTDGIHLGLYGELDRYMGETEIHFPSDLSDNYYTFGSTLTMPKLIDRAEFKLGYMYQRGRTFAEGEEYANAAANAGSPLYNGGTIVTSGTGTAGDIPLLDTFTRHVASAQMSYKVMDNVSARIGYTFNQLTYEDERIRGYTYNTPSSNAAAAWTQSGATMDWDYKAHVAYIAAEYTF